MTDEEIKKIAFYTAYYLELLREGEGKEEEPREATKRVSRPSDDEVRKYFEARGHEEMAEEFLDYEDAVGWKTNKGAIKDWKAACRNWIRRSGDFGRGEKKPVVTAETSGESFDLSEFVKLAEERAFDKELWN